MPGLLAPLLAGSAVIIPAGGRFSAKSFWKDACHFGATFYTAVPTMHQVPSLYHYVIVRPICTFNIKARQQAATVAILPNFQSPVSLARRFCRYHGAILRRPWIQYQNRLLSTGSLSCIYLLGLILLCVCRFCCPGRRRTTPGIARPR